MPQTGYCADITCSQVLTQLYECHCCQCFICLNHLLEHVQIAKRNQERVDVLRHDVSLVSSRLQTMVDKKLKEIEHEKRLIAQASQLFEMDRQPIEQIQDVLEAMNQSLAFYQTEEPIVKVESALSNATASYGYSTRKSILAAIPSIHEPICLSPPFSEENTCDDSKDLLTPDCAMDFDDPLVTDYVYVVSMNKATSDEEQNQHSIESRTTDEVNLPTCQTSVKRSTRLSAKEKKNNQPDLSPILGCEDPKTTKPLDEDEIEVFHRRTFPCVLSSRMINLLGRPPKLSEIVPCQSKLLVGHSMVTHLSRFHHIRPAAGKPLVKAYRDKLIKLIASNNSTEGLWTLF